MEFARMTEDQLRELCFAVDQIKQARTYAEAHLNKNDGEFQREVTKHSDSILRCKIDSHHSGTAKYCCWIEYTMEDANLRDSNLDDDDNPFCLWSFIRNSQLKLGIVNALQAQELVGVTHTLPVLFGF